MISFGHKPSKKIDVEKDLSGSFSFIMCFSIDNVMTVIYTRDTSIKITNKTMEFGTLYRLGKYWYMERHDDLVMITCYMDNDPIEVDFKVTGKSILDAHQKLVKILDERFEKVVSAKDGSIYKKDK